ncbi:MAG: hypothetical protein RR388_07650 [Rikenellaceae bacterium]
MRNIFNLLLLYAIFLSSCTKEDLSNCPPIVEEDVLLVRITGDYTPDNIDKLDLWIESQGHDHWYQIKHYSVVEIAGKDYVSFRLPTDNYYNFVAVGNVKAASVVVAPLPIDCNCDKTQQVPKPSDNSTIGYAASPQLPNHYMPIDNIFMSAPTLLYMPPKGLTPTKIDVPIDGVASLVKLVINTNSLTGKNVRVTVHNTSSGMKFNSEQLFADKPVHNSGVISGNGYNLNTIILPSVGTTSNISVLVDVTDNTTGEVTHFQQDNLHIAAKQIYVINFDGITFVVQAHDWNGNIDIDSPLD